MPLACFNVGMLLVPCGYKTQIAWDSQPLSPFGFCLYPFPFLAFGKFVPSQESVWNAPSDQFARQRDDHSTDARTSSRVKNLDSLSVLPLHPKETELKFVENPSMGILYAERKDGFVPPAYSERVIFGQHFGAEGIWKKFYTKFEFQRGPAYGIVKTRYRKKEIIYTRYRGFYRQCRLSVDRNRPEKKKNFEVERQVRVFRS